MGYFPFCWILVFWGNGNGRDGWGWQIWLEGWGMGDHHFIAGEFFWGLLVFFVALSFWVCGWLRSLWYEYCLGLHGYCCCREWGRGTNCGTEMTGLRMSETFGPFLEASMFLSSFTCSYERREEKGSLTFTICRMCGQFFGRAFYVCFPRCFFFGSLQFAKIPKQPYQRLCACFILVWLLLTSERAGGMGSGEFCHLWSV